MEAPNLIQHRLKVNQLKAQLPDDWLNRLQDRTGKRRTFVSQMINKFEDYRPEWKEVERLAKEYCESLQAAM